jgi:hypothetical protein
MSCESQRRARILDMIDIWLSETWQALAREAGSAAEHIAFGVTVLRRANYAQTAYYSQAFFSLSVGLERSCKLAMLLDYAIDHEGSFPANSVLRAYGHDLERLMTKAADINATRGFTNKPPTTLIHLSIIRTLSDFASNVTRYYNLEVLTGEAHARGRDDPISSWNEKVTKPILEAHYPESSRRRDEKNANALELLMGHMSRAFHSDEVGSPMITLYEQALNSARADFARRWERRYILQIARFIGRTIIDLTGTAQRRRMRIPFLDEFYSIFDNDDSYFLERKTWSIYR